MSLGDLHKCGSRDPLPPLWLHVAGFVGIFVALILIGWSMCP